MRVLVCGGRDFDGAGDLKIKMDALNKFKPITLLIHGGASGADSMAATWARLNGIEVKCFNADWKKHGRAAGPIRNKQMLDEGKPDLVVAFSGGAGTANMVCQAKKSGVNVIDAT